MQDAIKVGIPRAMSYYYMYPFYKGFLETLNVTPVVSPPTTKRTLDEMRYCPTDEPCVPVKLFFAHTKALVDRQVPYLFIPILTSLEEDNYCCPKFMGIEGMVRNGLRLPKDMILAPRINFKDKTKDWRDTFKSCTERLGITDETLALKAIEAGWKMQREYQRLASEERLTTIEAFRRLDNQPPPKRKVYNREAQFDPDSPIGVIGHAYVLYDLIGHNIVDRLREYGPVYTPEMVPEAEAKAQLETVAEGQKMWTFEGLMLGCALYLLRNHLVTKIILVGPFECGPESIVENFIEAEAEKLNVPFLLLNVDEQTGEAGLVTRLEAFMDTAVSYHPMPGLKQQASTKPESSLDGTGHTPTKVLNARFNHKKHALLKLRSNKAATRFKLGKPQALPPRLKDGRWAHAPWRKGFASEESHTRNAKESIWAKLARPFRGPEPNGMIVGTPSMGFLDIALRAAFEECGIKTVKTPKPTKRTVELGKEIAPEFICYPLVTTIGQMREVLELGANTIFMVGGKGRCRLGWYAEVQEILLKRLGYSFEMVVIDSPVPLKTNGLAFYRTLKYITNNSSLWRIYQALKFGYHKMAALDEGERLLNQMRAYERNRGSAEKLFKQFMKSIDRASTIKEIKQAMETYKGELEALEKEDVDPLRVRIVGEIYVLLEPFVNQNIEKLLGSREHIRVEVNRELSATSWFREHILRSKDLKARHRYIRQAAAPYLDELVGGHGTESIGLTVLSKQEGFDGVIHILPFTCMPEIVAQNIIVRVAEDMDIPVMSLIVSEQTGEAGLITRLEAFLDVLEERRRHTKARQWVNNFEHKWKQQSSV